MLLLHGNAFPGPRIAADPGATPFHRKRSESAQFNAVADGLHGTGKESVTPGDLRVDDDSRMHAFRMRCVLSHTGPHTTASAW